MTDPLPQENNAEPVITNEVPVAANNNNPQPPAPAEKKKCLSTTFNLVSMGLGFAATALTKTLVAQAMIASCPAWGILIATSCAVGLLTTAINHEKNRYKEKNTDGTAPAYFSKQNLKDIFNGQNARALFSKKNGLAAAKSTAFALLGGALFLGFHEGTFQHAFHSVFGGADIAVSPSVETIPTVTPSVEQTAAAPIALPVEVPVEAPTPPVAAAPVEVLPVYCPSPMENFSSLIEGHDVSDRVQDAMHRAASANARVAAQGAKDLAYFAFNGFDGVPKDPTVALHLFQQAADAGNVQAQIDLLYTQFHGLGGVTANPQAAVEAMQQIRSPRAAEFVAEWTGHAAKAVHGGAFDSKAILQGVKFCP